MRRFAGCSCIALRCPSGAVLYAAVATRYGLRLAGLAGLSSLPADRALLIPRCRSVHTIGMRFALDVAFVGWSRRGATAEVLALHEGVHPLRLARSPHDAPSQAALEMRAGTAAHTGLRAGAHIERAGYSGSLRSSPGQTPVSR